MTTINSEDRALIELKPCPFCAGEAIRCENLTGVVMFWTQCGECHACPGGDHPTRRKADDAWNTRTELKLDETIARSSPGGVVDFSTFEALEEALDKADAPITDGGRFLTLVERISALGRRTEGSTSGEVLERVARLLCRQHYGDRGLSQPGINNVVESDWPGWVHKAEEVVSALSIPREASDMLAWLAEHRGLELDYGFDAEEEDMFWRVHERSGNVNDREWDLIGQGATPLAALLSAKSYLEATNAEQPE